MLASIALLGGFDVRLGDGTPLDLPTQKYKALLAFLAMSPGQSHPRDKLVALLWGDLARQQGRAALRQAVWTLRRALDAAPPQALSINGGVIGLNADAVTSDVVAFEQACTAGDIKSLERAAALYRGDFLAGLAAREEPFEEWLAAQRERLAELALSALARLLAQQRKAGLFEEAVQTALRLIAIDPLQEPIHRALMELYVQVGRRSAALRHYRQCARIFQRELGCDPGAETQALYQAIVVQRLPTSRPSQSVRSEISEESDKPFMLSVPRIADESRMIGRSAELALFEEALDQIAAKRGQVAVVFGEPGIGKSRLIAAVAVRAAERGARVLVGRCFESEQVLTFGPWIDALGAIDKGEAIEKLGPNLRAALATLGQSARVGAEPGETDYRLLFEAIAQFLAALAVRQPLVLFLEDVHWADEMSLRLFSFIARRFQRMSLLLAFTARHEEVDETSLLSRILDDLDRDLAALHLSLPPLTREDTTEAVAALVQMAPSAPDLRRLSERIWRISEGNPFMIVETLRVLRDEPGIDVRADIALPERVRRVVTRRLDRLSITARQLLASAAVVGRDFTFPLAQRVSDLSEAESLAGFEELVRRGLLRETGERFDVSHDSIRRVAIDALLPPRRRLLHRRVAEALEAFHAHDLKPHYVALGYHYAEAEIWEQASVYLERAGRQAWERGAYREGIVTFKQALAAIPNMPDSRKATELAFDMYIRLILLCHIVGDIAAMADYVRLATQAVARLGDEYRTCLLQIHAAHYRFVVRDHSGSVHLSRAALAAADALENTYLRALAHHRLGGAYLNAGDYPNAIRSLEIATAEMGSSSEQEAWSSFSYSAKELAYHFIVAQLVAALCDVGRYDSARRHAEGALGVLSGRFTRLAFTSWALGWQRAHQGRIEESIEPLERALELLREQQFAMYLPQTIAALAFVFALLGRTQDAARVLDGSGTDLLPVKVPWREPLVFSLLAKALCFMNRVSEAREYAERALQGSIAFSEPSNEAEARLALAMIGTGSHEWDRDTRQQTLEHLRAASTLAERLGMRPLRAHCHYYTYVAFHRSGLDGEANAELERALDLYRAMDMRFWLKRAEAASVSLPV